MSPRYLGRLGDDAVVLQRNGNGTPLITTDGQHDTGAGAAQP
jgi:hypothetical protein